MKVIQTMPGMRSNVTEAEVEKFLESKLNMQLATVDPQGYPVIQPVWFYYDRDAGKLYTGTNRMSRKLVNLRKDASKLYFSIDDENLPYRGVKGRGEAIISEDIKNNVAIIEKMNMKYLGTQDHPIAKFLNENARNGTEVVIEITPRFFSAWDFSKY